MCQIRVIFGDILKIKGIKWEVLDEHKRLFLFLSSLKFKTVFKDFMKRVRLMNAWTPSLVYQFLAQPLPSISAMPISALTVRDTPSGGDLCTWLDVVDGMFVQKHLWTRKVKVMFTSAVRHGIYVSCGCGCLMLMLISDVNVPGGK